MNDLKSISDDGPQGLAANSLPHGPAEVLWLRVSFSARFDAAGVERWRKRLHAFLARCGLVAAISPERVAIFPVGKPITSFDRGLVIGWLTAQPEVVFVHIDRGAAGARRADAYAGAT